MKRIFVVTLLMLCSFFIGLNATAMEEEVIASTEEPICENPDIVSVKAKKIPHKGYAVFVDNKQAMWFVKDLESISAQKRAEIVVEKLNKALMAGVSPASIRPVKSGKYTFLQAGEEKLVTVDSITAKAFGVSVHELAYSWANNTRIALGADSLRKDYADVSRGFTGKDSRYLGHTMTGMASWYGPTFHGRRAADGSRFNTQEYTAAHKTYPFGTLVKVTNLKTHKSCVVKITDRGPYAHGRVIDLSKKAAEDIGMLGSGVAKVKLEVVGQY